MLSGFGKEYPLFLESKVDYAYKGFNLPFVVNAEVMYIIVQKINLPNDLEQINLLIKTEVPEISYTEFECFSDSIYSLKIHNKDSILVGEFSILPVSLSVEKLDEFEYWAYISSCFIGLLNPKIIRYKNFIFRPSCGFNRLIDKELIDKFYAALESVQTE
jgi:hypothetical protein